MLLLTNILIRSDISTDFITHFNLQSQQDTLARYLTAAVCRYSVTIYLEVKTYQLHLI